MTELVVLAIAGLLAGYINSIAGAGSLLTLPALIFTGLDAVAANATNRVAVLFQNIAAIVAFGRAGLGKASRAALWLSLPAVATSAVGAWISTLLTDAQLKVCIAVAMVIFLVLSLVPRRKLEAEVEVEAVVDDEGRVRWPMALGFAVIGLYAGFLQAGVGILILLYMSLVHGVGLVTANAMKVVLILLLAAAAIVVFVYLGAGIDPLRGLVLAASTTAGGYLGARAAVRGGERFVRVVLTLVVLASVAKLAWDGLHG